MQLVIEINYTTVKKSTRIVIHHLKCKNARFVIRTLSATYVTKKARSVEEKDTTKQKWKKSEIK